MPRVYDRKTNRGSWDEESMLKAIEAVKTHQCGTLKASKIYGVPRSTLQRRVREKNEPQSSGAGKYLGGYTTVFSPEFEQELVGYLHELEVTFHGYTRKDLCSFAYELAEKNKLVQKFSNSKQATGCD